MRLFAYKMVRDYGFAPNPFDGFCTLATCKPKIRKAAKEGDLIIACGSAKNGFAGRAICALRVTGKSTFQQYWDNPLFKRKRPILGLSRRRAFGDNIYHRDPEGNWIQEDSHHSLHEGISNQLNLMRDTSSDHVLWSDDFIYWGREAVDIPPEFGGFNLDRVRDERSRYDANFIAAVDDWFRSIAPRGRVGRPIDWA